MSEYGQSLAARALDGALRPLASQYQTARILGVICSWCCSSEAGSSTCRHAEQLRHGGGHGARHHWRGDRVAHLACGDSCPSPDAHSRGPSTWPHTSDPRAADRPCPCWGRQGRFGNSAQLGINRREKHIISESPSSGLAALGALRYLAHDRSWGLRRRRRSAAQHHLRRARRQCHARRGRCDDRVQPDHVLRSGEQRPAGSMWDPGMYVIGDNPNDFQPSGRTDDAGDNMLIVNGFTETDQEGAVGLSARRGLHHARLERHVHVRGEHGEHLAAVGCQ